MLALLLIGIKIDSVIIHLSPAYRVLGYGIQVASVSIVGKDLNEIRRPLILDDGETMVVIYDWTYRGGKKELLEDSEGGNPSLQYEWVMRGGEDTWYLYTGPTGWVFMGFLGNTLTPKVKKIKGTVRFGPESECKSVKTTFIWRIIEKP